MHQSVIYRHQYIYEQQLLFNASQQQATWRVLLKFAFVCVLYGSKLVLCPYAPVIFIYLHQLFDIHFHNYFYSLLLIAFVLMEGIFVKYSSLLHVLRLCRAASEDKNCRKIKRNEDSKHFTLEVCQWMLANKPIINN